MPPILSHFEFGIKIIAIILEYVVIGKLGELKINFVTCRMGLAH